MDVLVVRHAIAVERGELETGTSDAERPLTAKGKARMGEGARGLVKLVPALDLVVTSPLRRAVQTAQILRKAYGGLECVETPALLPDAEPKELSAFLSGYDAEWKVAVVGHEPHLGRFVGHCLAGKTRTMVEMKKGGACLLRFDGAPIGGRGTLEWLLPPSVLRSI